MREFVERNLKELDEVYFVIGNSVPAGTEEWKVRRERSGSFFEFHLQDGFCFIWKGLWKRFITIVQIAFSSRFLNKRFFI